MKKTVKKLFVVCLMLLALTITGQAKTYAIISSIQVKEVISDADEGAQKLDSAKIRAFLLNDTLSTLKVTKIIQIDEAGDTLRNDDGTVKYYYFLTDVSGTVYDANSVDMILKARGVLWKRFGAKKGLGTLVGAGMGYLKGGAKGALKGAVSGAATGALLSMDEIQQIAKANKNLKKIRKSLEAYKETFTEEGLPKDPSADLSKVKGLGDFDKAEALSKETAELKAELENSVASANNLEALDLDSILK